MKNRKHAGHALAAAGLLALAITGTTAAQAQAQPEGTSSSALQYFSEESESGGISHSIGDRYNGPGTLTVGRVGTKKQLVLPAGQWVALAAADYRTSGGVDMTAVAFGSFNGKRLRSLLQMTFNRNVAPAQTWSDFNLCAEDDKQALLRAGTPDSAMRNECVLVKAQADVNLAQGPAGNALVKNLARLGAEAGGPAVTSTVMLAEKRWGFIRITRSDYLPSDQASDWSPASIEASPARSAQAKALLAWVERYRQAANEGFRRNYSEHDLAAASGAPSASQPSPPGLAALGDFSFSDGARVSVR